MKIICWLLLIVSIRSITMDFLACTINLNTVYQELDSGGTPMDNPGHHYTFYIPTPAVYSTHNNVGLALAGFNIAFSQYVDFQAHITSTGSSLIIVEVIPYQDFQIYTLGYYVIMLKPISNYIWMQPNISI